MYKTLYITQLLYNSVFVQHFFWDLFIALINISIILLLTGQQFKEYLWPFHPPQKKKKVNLKHKFNQMMWFDTAGNSFKGGVVHKQVHMRWTLDHSTVSGLISELTNVEKLYYYATKWPVGIQVKWARLVTWKMCCGHSGTIVFRPLL